MIAAAIVAWLTIRRSGLSPELLAWLFPAATVEAILEIVFIVHLTTGG